MVPFSHPSHPVPSSPILISALSPPRVIFVPINLLWPFLLFNTLSARPLPPRPSKPHYITHSALIMKRAS